MLASMALMTGITAVAGFTRLLGLGHVLWIPQLVFLWGGLADHPAGTAVGLWLRVVIAINAVSLLVDGMDVTRYLSGDRRELA